MTPMIGIGVGTCGTCSSPTRNTAATSPTRPDLESGSRYVALASSAIPLTPLSDLNVLGLENTNPLTADHEQERFSFVPWNTQSIRDAGRSSGRGGSAAESVTA
jgi:hypothetical protein